MSVRDFLPDPEVAGEAFEALVDALTEARLDEALAETFPASDPPAAQRFD